MSDDSTARSMRSLELKPSRRSYVHVVRGEARVNGIALGAGDALKLTDAPAVASMVAERPKFWCSICPEPYQMFHA